MNNSLIQFVKKFQHQYLRVIKQLQYTAKFNKRYNETLMVSARTSADFDDRPQPVKFSDVTLSEFFITWHSTTASTPSLPITIQ